MELIQIMDTPHSETTTAPCIDNLGNGEWSIGSFDISSLADGSLTVEISYSDESGNEVSQTHTVTKDILAVAVTIADPSNILKGDPNNYSIEGGCTENGREVTIEVTDGSQPVTPSPQPNCQSAQWSTTIDHSSLSEGDLTITVTHEDADGGSFSIDQGILKDLVDPTMSLSIAEAINHSTETNYSLSGTCSDVEGRVEVILTDSDGTPNTALTEVACADNSGSLEWEVTGFDVTALSEGVITVSATHWDIAGNLVVDNTTTLTKDTILPTLILNSPGNMNAVSVVIDIFTLSGTCDEANGVVNLTLTSDGGGSPLTDSATCTSNLWEALVNVSTLFDGNITIEASLLDGVGNEALFTPVTIVKDIEPPEVRIISAPHINLATVLTQYTLSGTCSERGRNVSVEIRDHVEGNINAQTVNGSTPCLESYGTWSLEMDVTSLRDTTSIHINVTHEDEGENSDVATLQIIKDLTPSVVTLNALEDINATTDLMSYALGGTCSDSSRTVDVEFQTGGGSNNGGQSVFLAPPIFCIHNEGVDNTWSGDVDISALSDGAVKVKISHADAAGNPSEEIVDITKDIVLPQVGLNSPSSINSNTPNNYSLSGTCSEVDSEVQVSLTHKANMSQTVSPSPLPTCQSGGLGAHK